MSDNEKLKILSDILGRNFTSGPEHLYTCPKCSHHKLKLSVNLSKDKFKCWVCDYAGHSIRRLIKSNGSFTQLADWDRLNGKTDISLFEQLFATEAPPPEVEVELPKEFVSLTSKKLPLSSRPAMEYLSQRGISKEDILRWKIGCCARGEYKDRIVIPSFGEAGKLNYFVGRSYSNDWRKYDQPAVSRDIVFNHLYVDWDSDIIIVEGVFDAIVSGPNSIPILGSVLKENSKLFQEIVRHDSTVYIALDPDAERKALKLIKQLLEYGVELYKVNIQPYGDVGEMFKDEFGRRKTQALEMTEASYLKYCARNGIF
jgi:DNA primase